MLKIENDNASALSGVDIFEGADAKYPAFQIPPYYNHTNDYPHLVLLKAHGWRTEDEWYAQSSYNSTIGVTEVYE